MTLLRHLRNSVSRLPVGRAVAGLAVFGAGVFAAGAFSSAVPAAPQDLCVPVVGCVTTTIPTVTLPTVTLPTTTTTTTTPTTTSGGGTTTTAGSGGNSGGSTTTSATTTTDTSATSSAGLSVEVRVRVIGHGAKRTIEVRLRLSKPARVSALLSRNGKALQRNQFSAATGSSVWGLRLGPKVKAGAAKLGLTYRSTTGEIARSSHRLRLPR